MDLRQLAYFLEVAKYNSFTAAAQAAHVSQPAVSKTIQALEDELGVVLFARTSRSVELTDSGAAVHAKIQKVMQQLQDIRAELDDVAGLRKGHVRIGLPPMVGETFFPQIVGLFHQLYPQIKIQLYEAGAKTVENRVAGGELDVGVALLPINEALFACYEFCRDPLMLVVYPEHPLAACQAVNFPQLKGETLILYRQDFALHAMIYDGCTRAGFEPDIICETSQWDFMAKTVAARLGISFLPARVCQQLPGEKYKFIALENPRIYWHLAIIWRRNQYLSHAARKWIDFAKFWLAQ